MDGTTTTTSGGADEERLVDAPAADQPQLLATAVGDQCANCGARLAGDQRYCVECGERRGKARYALPGSAGGATASSLPSRGGRRPRLTSSGTLIAGVGTLLLAMGVGVLIGRTSNGSSSRSPAVQVITVASGTSGATGSTAGGTATTTSTPGTTSSGATSSTSKKKAKGAAASLAAKLPPKAKVIPKSLQSKVAKVGSKCAGGGKFTGTYFGAGASRTGCSK